MALAEVRDGVDRLDLQIRLGGGTVTWDGLRSPLGRWAENQRLTPEKRRNLVRAFERAAGDIARQ
jgi:hypothetical protein